MAGKKGKVFVISAPSGSGKSTLIKELVKEAEGLAFSISHTTRGMRDGEVDGVHYHFVTPEQFKKMIRQGAFIEWANVHGKLYGTSYKAVESELAGGKDVILDIDVQGAESIDGKLDGQVKIFIMPPSIKELEKRLKGRGESPENIKTRLANAAEEMVKVVDYDYVIINDNMDTAAHQLIRIVAVRRLD